MNIGQIIRDCPDCPEMVAVPQVGHTASNPGKPFYAERYELTWHEYLVAVKEGACPIPLNSSYREYDLRNIRLDDSNPLTGVTMDIFPCYLRYLYKKTGKQYRIPSPDEWEHIARAGTTSKYYWGDSLGFNNAVVEGFFDKKTLRQRLGYPADQPNFLLNEPRWAVEIGKVYPVGQFRPNPWGLYDVIGNAAEFTTEPYPPNTECLKKYAVKFCEGISVRGSLTAYKDPKVDTGSIMTTRYKAMAHFGQHDAGFRLIRN